MCFGFLFSLAQTYDQKNIRRRVYDALNVLMAMDIIEKKKKDIRWIGLPTNSVQEHFQLQVRTSPHGVFSSFVVAYFKPLPSTQEVHADTGENMAQALLSSVPMTYPPRE